MRPLPAIRSHPSAGAQRPRWRERQAFASALVPIIAALVSARAGADCIDDAAAHHRVNALVLRAIGWQESRLDPQARNSNRNGTVDIGAFQINSVHLPVLARHGVDRATLADACVSAYVGAWHYAQQMSAFGNTWAAVGAYHSRQPERAAAYANGVAAQLMRWGAMARGPLPYPAASAATSLSAASAAPVVAPFRARR